MKRRLMIWQWIAWLALVGTGSGLAAPGQTVALAPGEIKAIDRVHMTLTIHHPKSDKDTVVRITSRTRLFVNRKYGTTRDLSPGDFIIGTAQRKDKGDLEAVRLYVETRHHKPKKDQESPEKSLSDTSSP